MQSDLSCLSSHKAQTPTKKEYGCIHDEMEWSYGGAANSNQQRDANSESMSDTAEPGLDISQLLQDYEIEDVD